MSSGYTRDQLADLLLKFHENVPPEITKADFNAPAKVQDISMAGTEFGALIRLRFIDDNELDFFLNCVVALELVACLYSAGVTSGWWNKKHADPVGFTIPQPSREDLDIAFDVVSFCIGTGPSGVIVTFNGGPMAYQFYMRRKVVADVLTGLQQAADIAGWWDENMELRAVDGERLQ
jgi:hypothetical protein